MNKKLAVFLASILMLSLAACTPPSGERTGRVSGGGGDLRGEIGGELTISCYDTMQYKSFLETAAEKFKEKYPGTDVTVETFSAMPEIKVSEQGDRRMAAIRIEDDPQGRSDYINKVGANLMSGKGADIYAMDVLPVYKYADGGQLEDLSSYMDTDPDFNREDYKTNILDAVKWNNGTWFMPMDFSFNYYNYDSTLLTDGSQFGPDIALTVGQLVETAETDFASSGAAGMFDVYNYSERGQSLFSQLMGENYSTFVDIENKKANFNDGRFEDLLNSVDEYATKGYVGFNPMEQQGGLPEGDFPPEGGRAMRTQGDMPDVTDRYFFKSKNNMSLMSQFNRDSGRQMRFAFGGGNQSVESDDEIAGIQAAGEGKVPFTYSQAYGINSDSGNKQTAWAFIKFLLSEEMQTSANMSFQSFALNNAAREKNAENSITGAFGGGRTVFFAGGPEGQPQSGEGAQPKEQPQPGGGAQPEEQTEPAELDDAQREVLRKYTDAYERMSSQINTFIIKDSIIDDMIASETQYFFDGSKSAAEVANALQSKADLYLSE